MMSRSFFLVFCAMTGMAFAQTWQEAMPPGYYDDNPVLHLNYSASRASYVPSTPGKVYLVELPAGENETVGIVPAGAPVKASEIGQPLPALLPDMEKGVVNLEKGTGDLKQYTIDMGLHLERNGIRGFLLIPQNLKEQGHAIGQTLGEGVSDIVKEVGKEMVKPEAAQ
jgi:hypothetical protein